MRSGFTLHPHSTPLQRFDFDLVDPWKYFVGLLYDDMANLADEIREYKVGWIFHGSTCVH